MKEIIVKLSGDVHIAHYDSNMDLIQERSDCNLVVTSGLAHIISRLKDATSAAMGYIAVGSNSTAAAAGQTALSAIIGAKVAVDSAPAIVTKNVANDTLQFVCTFAPGVSTGAWIEAGIFNSSDVMLSRLVFAEGVVNKAAGDTITLTWKITAVAA